MCWGLKIGPARAVDFFLAAEIWDLGWSWGGLRGTKTKTKRQTRSRNGTRNREPRTLGSPGQGRWAPGHTETRIETRPETGSRASLARHFLFLVSLCPNVLASRVPADQQPASRDFRRERFVSIGQTIVLLQVTRTRNSNKQQKNKQNKQTTKNTNETTKHKKT